MAMELTVVMRFEHDYDAPTREDIEYAFDTDVVEYEEENDV